MKVDEHGIIVEGKFITVARIEDEWYEDIIEPEVLAKNIKEKRPDVDILTFWKRFPDIQPLYNYYYELESIAVLPIKGYDYWWKNQIKSKRRNLVKKAKKHGVVIKECEYDDEFVKGMTDIFNEFPIRQGKPFWHYGKDFNTIKREFSKYIYRETLIGAFLEKELIGFVMLGNAGKYALTGQIISKIKHRDKAPNDALIAKAVETCDQRSIPYLIYYFWSDDNLSEFKRRCGFEKVEIPRYYIPLTTKGRIAININLHHGFKGMLPNPMVRFLKNLRKKWYDWRGKIGYA
jgi:hypothetical protein